MVISLNLGPLRSNCFVGTPIKIMHDVRDQLKRVKFWVCPRELYYIHVLNMYKNDRGGGFQKSYTTKITNFVLFSDLNYVKIEKCCL